MKSSDVQSAVQNVTKSGDLGEIGDVDITYLPNVEGISNFDFLSHLLTTGSQRGRKFQGNV